MILDRTFHPDEANQAFTTGRLLETGAYAYKPTDHHGPTLYYAAAPIQKIAGASDVASLDGAALRCTPLVFAVLALALGFAAVRRVTRSAMAAAAFVLLLGTAPFFVFFATDFIQEMLLLCFLVGTYFAGVGYLRPGGRVKPGSWALMFGIFAGLAFATKETSVLSFGAAAVAGLPFIVSAAAARRKSPPPPDTPPSHLFRDAVFAVAAFLMTSVALFSSFCSDWTGVFNAFVAAPMAYLGRAAGDAAASTGANWHVHPFTQYFKWLFAKPPFTELDLFAVAFAVIPASLGLLRIARAREEARRAHFISLKPEKKAAPSDLPSLAPFAFAAAYTLVLALVYSAIPYKTPWCALQFLPGAALTAALGMHAVSARIGRKSVSTLICAGIVAGVVFHRWPALVKMNADPDSREIPCNYANASPEAQLLAKTVADAMKAPCADEFIAVALPASDTWPFPWYNRALESKTGYWTEFEALKKLAEAGARPSVVIVPMTEGHLVQPLFPHLKNTKRFYMRDRVRVRVFW